MRDRTRFRRLALAAALACCALTLGFGAGSASASPCFPIVTANHPTGYTQPDGTVLTTAALVNPPDATVPENVDASGCDIGVFYDTSASHYLAHKNVFGATYYGVLSTGAGVTTNITLSSVHETGNHPHDGTQHGVDVAY